MSLFNRLVPADALPVHRSQIALVSPLTGKVAALDMLSHPVYVHRLMGEGAVIDPTGYQLLAPFDGKVVEIANMANRIVLRSAQGIRLNIQLGMDSDSMMGEGFKAHCKTGQNISTGQLLIEFDLNKMKRKLHDHRCAVTVLNSDKLKGVVITAKHVMAGQDPVFRMLI